jgi:hypothetical protein
MLLVRETMDVVGNPDMVSRSVTPDKRRPDMPLIEFR